MFVTDFDFDLPPELIAQYPPAHRADSRLMLLERRSGRITHAHISELPSLLAPGDLVVVNDTRVFPARLIGKRLPGGGAVECLLLQRREDGTWDALVHPGQRLKPGGRMVFERGDAHLEGEIVGRGSYGRRIVRFSGDDEAAFDAAVDVLGDVPLPPYIRRKADLADRERYQTVYARARGSVAAPTAGLHLTPELFEALSARGVDTVALTLHVGYGTFSPVRTDRVEEHRVEAERWSLSVDAAMALNSALDAGRRVVAVGTTTTRALETVAAAHGGRLVSGAGEADLFIYPGFHFQVINGLLTNFHLPRSSLLMLVSAFAGREQVLNAYREAVAHRYRFYSYGDAMLIL